MKRTIAKMAVLLGFLLSLNAPEAKSAQQADLVITGAEIYTVDDCRRWAHAMAVSKGNIVFVGDDAGARAYVGPATEKIELHGEMILPGFHDSHVHPVESGIELSHCRLDDAAVAADILKRIAAYTKENPSSKWILGGGWSLPLFPDANPKKEDLDAIVSDRPAFFASQDAHSAWVNSAALKLAKIDRNTPDPPLGRIERNANGEPSGTLRESAVEMVSNLLPKHTESECLDGLRRALQMANGFGITSMQDAHCSEEFLQAYSDLANKGALTARIVAALYVDPQKDAGQVADLIQLRQKYLSSMVRPTSAKIFADGVIESHTAALMEPYSDKKESIGILNFAPDQMKSIVAALDKAGFQIHVHAIGDRAVNEALNALEFAKTENGVNDSRHHIAHLELVQATDIPRFRKLNIVANFQPFWAYRDPYITQCTEPLLGAQRTARLYQIGSMFKTGAVVAAGSDWSVTTLNPLDAMQVAVTRMGLNDTTGPAWLAEERVTLPEIISAYTINGAYVNHQEKVTGSLEAGKAADFVVLDKNLFTIALQDIHKTKVLMTYLNGRPVFKAATLARVVQQP